MDTTGFGSTSAWYREMSALRWINRVEARLAPTLALSGIAIGIVIRAQFALVGDFPLGDGGLFYAMARDIQRAGYALPLYTSYNNANIPFAYPPLQIWLAAVLDGYTPMTLLTIMRLSPLAASVLTVGAFYLVARELLSHRNEAAMAAAAFALTPGSFYWPLMGGGLTRSWGFLFALLTIAQVIRMYRDGKTRQKISASILAALTTTSHPGAAFFAAIACALLFLSKGRSKAGALSSLVVAFGAAVLSAPWWLSVLLRLGPLPFGSAMGQGSSRLLALIYLLLPGLMQFNVSLVAEFLAVLGCMSAVTDRRYLVPGWLAAMVALEPREFEWYSVVPLSLLAGIGAAYLLKSAVLAKPAASPVKTLALCLSLAMLAIATLSGELTRAALSPLSADERAAMAWVKSNTPATSSFLVLGSDAPSRIDSEWFPALTGRVSVATHQGYEWRGIAEFSRRGALYNAALSCVASGTQCLNRLASSNGIYFDHIFLSPPLKQSLLGRELQRDPSYVMIYDSPGASIFSRSGTESSTPWGTAGRSSQ